MQLIFHSLSHFLLLHFLSKGQNYNFFFFTVRLVERNDTPNGYQLLNSQSVGRHDALDLVSLAQEIQNVDVAACSQTGKISLISEQVRRTPTPST